VVSERWTDSYRRALCWLYAIVAVIALAGTWHQNVAYVRTDESAMIGFVAATARFWRDTFATPASTSITIDLGLLMIPLCTLMVIEARRVEVRFVWAYIVLGIVIAISVTYPLFLIARERRLSARGEPCMPLGFADAAALAILGAVMVSVTVRTLFR
jgi:Gpi18-like mannosyltransferase